MRTILLLAVLVICAASATAPGRHAVKKTIYVKASYDDTWTAVIDVFADRSWPIQNMAKDSGLITTDWMKADEGFADCGGSGLAIEHGTYVRFNVRVKAAESTEVTVNATFRQDRSLDDAHHFADCETKGVVEQLIHTEVEKRIRAGVPARFDATAKEIQPRGHFCASSTNTGFCARERADCVTARDAAIAAIPDIGECALVETAHCFDSAGRERCFPTTEICAARAGAMECHERK